MGEGAAGRGGGEMNIGMVLYGLDFPPDIRVEKEARTLREAGHEVFLLCSNRNDRPQREVVDGIHVTRVPAAVPGRVPRALNSFTALTTFRSPFWARAMRLWIRDNSIEALHAHDLPGAPTVTDMGQLLRMPVVVDFHENYPAAVREWRRPTGAKRIFFTDQRLPALERSVVRAADRVIAVVPEAKVRFLAAGTPDHKLVVVSNTEPLSFGDEVMALPRDPRFGNDIVLLYAGGFGPHRGLEQVIGAMPQLIATGKPYRLVLAGDGPNAEALKELARELGVDQRVEFPGWVNAAEVKALIASADVGLVPHVKSEHTETTIPHKLFQYMVSGRAVAVSDCAPLARVVEESDCGVVVRGDSPDSWAGGLRHVTDRRKAASCGRAGRAACEACYDWERDGARLVEMYADIEAERSARH
jgi:glycosyltransferase involved in cell wall biosynthesis